MSESEEQETSQPFEQMEKGFTDNDCRCFFKILNFDEGSSRPNPARDFFLAAYDLASNQGGTRIIAHFTGWYDSNGIIQNYPSPYQETLPLSSMTSPSLFFRFTGSDLFETFADVRVACFSNRTNLNPETSTPAFQVDYRFFFESGITTYIFDEVDFRCTVPTIPPGKN